MSSKCILSARRAYRSLLTEAQLKPVHRSTGSVLPECVVPQAESTPIFFSESDLPEADSVADPAFDESSIADPTAFETGELAPDRDVVDPDLGESSIADPPAAESPMHQSFAVTFEVINDSTTKGKPKLIDSRGYSYGIKRRRANATDWVCTRRPKVNVVY